MSTERLEHMRLAAITCMELTKGFLPEQRNNQINAIDELAGYILELTGGDWIPVEDRLPERKEGWDHTERVLLWYKGDEHNVNQYGIGYYHYSPPHSAPGFVDFHYAFNGRKPTHWQPLPQPQKP